MFKAKLCQSFSADGAINEDTEEAFSFLTEVSAIIPCVEGEKISDKCLVTYHVPKDILTTNEHGEDVCLYTESRGILGAFSEIRGAYERIDVPYDALEKLAVAVSRAGSLIQGAIIDLTHEGQEKIKAAFDKNTGNFTCRLTEFVL